MMEGRSFNGNFDSFSRSEIVGQKPDNSFIINLGGINGAQTMVQVSGSSLNDEIVGKKEYLNENLKASSSSSDDVSELTRIQSGELVHESSTYVHDENDGSSNKMGQTSTIAEDRNDDYNRQLTNSSGSHGEFTAEEYEQIQQKQLFESYFG